jgi:hypothetical protein
MSQDLEAATNAIKLIKRLKNSIEEEARDYSINDLRTEINTFEKKYNTNGYVAKTLVESFKVITEHRAYSIKEFDNFKYHLKGFSELVKHSYLQCKFQNTNTHI